MNLDYSQIIASISLVIAALALFRNLKGDSKADAMQIAIMTGKLDNIGDDVREIKSDIKDVKTDIDNLKKSQALTEQSLTTAHGRIDRMEHELEKVKKTSSGT